jgi:hypothetical protein
VVLASVHEQSERHPLDPGQKCIAR